MPSTDKKFVVINDDGHLISVRVGIEGFSPTVDLSSTVNADTSSHKFVDKHLFRYDHNVNSNDYKMYYLLIRIQDIHDKRMSPFNNVSNDVILRRNAIARLEKANPSLPFNYEHTN